MAGGRARKQPINLIKQPTESGSPNRGQRKGVTPILSDFVRFAPIFADFRWGFADPGKQSADFVQFSADFVRFGVFANQTKADKISASPSGRPLLGLSSRLKRQPTPLPEWAISHAEWAVFLPEWAVSPKVP